MEPFASDPAAREALHRCLYLHGLGLNPDDPREDGSYWLAFQPEPKPIQSISIRGDTAKDGYPLLYGITLINPSNPAHLTRLDPAGPLPPLDPLLTGAVLADTTARQASIEALQRRLYTFADDLPTPAADELPRLLAGGYPGPHIRYKGDPLADMLTHEYFFSLGESILAGGATANQPQAEYGYCQHSIGTYWPVGQTGGGGWTRDLGRLMIERARAGRLDLAHAGLVYYARALFGCRYEDEHLVFRSDPPHWSFWYQSGPNGEPLAPGWLVRISQQPLAARAGAGQVRGQIENDGHGLLMLAFYTFWKLAGGNLAWLDQSITTVDGESKTFWDVLCTAAGWISWQLDHPLEVEGQPRD